MLLHEEGGAAFGQFEGALERFGSGGLDGGELVGGLLGFGEQGAHEAAFVGHGFAGEVGGLHTVGAFVDGGDAHVAHELGDAGFFDIACAAEYLHGQVGEHGAVVAAPGFNDGDEVVEPAFGGFFGGGFGVLVRGIERGGGLEIQGALGGDGGFLHQQHAGDVGVVDDGEWGAVGCAALDALVGVGQCLLVGGLGHGMAFDAHA